MAAFELEAIIKLTDTAFREGLSKVGKTISNFAKVSAVAMTAAATGVATLVKQSVDAYGEFEQLAGGVRKLYGNAGQSLEEYAEAQGKSIDEAKAQWQSLEDAQNAVLENAKKAYATSGMDMNTYMGMATSFSAKLINDLGGDSAKAAQLTDVAMRAISDNWNTFGGDLASIQSAYAGFSKQNYNMLDNLKLGYGGTKKEMERLIEDANEFAKANGEAANMSIDSFADIVRAIDLIQQKQGIAGTTAKEAATTIQGALNSTKAAWTNLLIAMGDKDADLSVYFKALGNSIKNFAKSAIPVAKQALQSLVDLIPELGVMLSTEIPRLVADLLPGLLDAATQLVTGVVSFIVEQAPAMIDSGSQMLTNIIAGFVEAIPQINETVVTMISLLFSALISNGPKLIAAGASLIVALISGLSSNIPALIPKAIEVITVLLSALISHAPELLTAGVEFISQIISGLVNNFPQLIANAGMLFAQLLGELLGWAAGAADAGKKVVDSIMSGIKRAWDTFTSWFKGIWDSFFGSLTANPKVNIEGAFNLGAGTYATGLDYVPYDMFPAYLHEGEAILTKEEANAWRNGSGGGVTINQYIQAVPQTPVEIGAATESYFEQARWALA